MSVATLNVWTEFNKYKTAKCKCCGKKLLPNEKIASVSQAQGKFTSISNYHLECAEPILKDITEELSRLMNNVLFVSDQIDTLKELKNCNV
jgi:hypothetical protein